MALVTGVSRHHGIGKAICIELAKKQYNIFFTYLKAYDITMPWQIGECEPEEIQQEILSLNVKCEKLEIDLNSSDAPSIVFARAIDYIGPVNCLINNATHSTSSNINTISSKELDDHYAINLKATTLLIKEFMNQHKGNFGRIINMTSGQSLGQMNCEIAYAMTKGAIETLTKTIYSELAEKGITINAVNPGPNDTGWMTPKLKEELLNRFPMGRVGKPTDTANLIAFLCSDEAAWITGQVIHSEGGFLR